MALDPALLALVKSAKNKYSRSSKSVKLKEGKTTIRVVGKPGEKFWAENGVHWIKTEKNGKPVAVVGCDDEVHQKPCAICTAIDKASKSASDDETLAIIKEWKMKKTVLINALIRSGADVSEDPQVVELPPTAFGQILATIDEYQAADVDILDFAVGVDFVVERMGKGLDTEYRVMVAPKSKPVPAGTIEKLHDLQAYIEKEFFRGDERKALTAIANMTGINVGAALSGPASTVLLTGPAGAVDDAIVEEAVVEELEAGEVAAPVLPTKAAVAAAKPAVKPTASATPPATAAAKPAAPATAPADFGAAMGKDEVAAMLAELDEAPVA
jgi:hypothetical protein